ncbi:MAG: serine/threonine protein kinase [Chitinispirillia bacterium]|nr:serine/threonine protein kinase [Chitinispirillia bacterium]
MDAQVNEQQTQTLHLPHEGEKVGSGIVLSRINAGGTACVYKTWVESLELHRAVKVMLPDAGPGTRERFSTEARITSKLTHLNIVQVHNCGETASGLPYIEMEFVNGFTLEAVLKQRGAMPLPAALAVAAGVLDALHYAHNITYTLYGQQHSGAMHRDIKPGNIIFSGGTPKLMDFGIARPVEVSMHTMTGTIPGTVPYMAPEMCGGGACDFRSDVYQIGLLLYECISGRPPYPQPDFMSLIAAISAGERKPLDTHPKAAAIINKCTELDPNKRYESAYECLEDVRALYNNLNPHTAPEECILAFFKGTEEPSKKAKSKRAKQKNDGKKRSKAAAFTLIFFLILFGLGVGLFFNNPDFRRLILKKLDTPAVPAAAPAVNYESMYHWLSVPEPEPAATPEYEHELESGPDYYNYTEADLESAAEYGSEYEQHSR